MQDSSARGVQFVPKRAAETASSKPLKTKQNHSMDWRNVEASALVGDWTYGPCGPPWDMVPKQEVLAGFKERLIRSHWLAVWVTACMCGW